MSKRVSVELRVDDAVTYEDYSRLCAEILFLRDWIEGVNSGNRPAWRMRWSAHPRRWFLLLTKPSFRRAQRHEPFVPFDHLPGHPGWEPSEVSA